MKEKDTYDHLGLKANIHPTRSDRVLEKVRKGRKIFNAASGLGLKPGGLTVKTCSLLFWSMVIPAVLYASELWVLNDNDITILDAFQRYVGRKVQRFPPRSPNETSYVGLGWLRLELFIYVKKLLFVRTVAVLEDDSIYKEVFVKRARQFDGNIEVGFENKNGSPVFDILKVAHLFELYDEVMRMITGVAFYSKRRWKDLIWSKAWVLENRDWNLRSCLFKATRNIRSLNTNVQYLIWWQLSDLRPDLMSVCESMSKIVCKASLLKADDYRLKREPASVRACSACDLYQLEDARHIIMTCTYTQDIRTDMFRRLGEIELNRGQSILDKGDTLMYLLGKQCLEVTIDLNNEFHIESARHIDLMYRTIVTRRKGIG